MPPAFVSVRFRCSRKICLTLCRPAHFRKMLLLPCEGRHESFTGDEREVRSVFCRQRRRKNSFCPSDGTLVGRAAERFEIDGDERRMRRKTLRTSRSSPV